MRALAICGCVILLAATMAAQSFTVYWSSSEQVNPDGSVSVTPTVEVAGYDDSSFTSNCIDSTNIATNRPALMLNGNPWFTHGRLTGGWWMDFAVTGPAVQIGAGQQADLSYGASVDAACWYDSPGGAPGFDSWYSSESQFRDEVGSPCFIAVNCPQPLPQVEYPSTYTATVTVFGELVKQVLATPTNFQLGPGTSDSNGNLIFSSISWQSSSGNLNDLSACVVGEYVTYPGTGPFNWPSPPYQSGTPAANPTITSVPATTGGQGTGDVHSHPGFLKPYASANFDSSQTYRWSCSNFANGQWYNFANYTISRGVNQHPSNNNWYYLITKAGYSASVDPLP